jgi:YidC/Oxa1 family membrane protein insertase
MQQHKNLIITIALSAVIMFGWQFLYEMPKLHKEQAALQQQQAAQQAVEAANPPGTSPAGGAASVPASAAPATTPVPAQPVATRVEALALSPRVPIDTPRLSGSIALKGGRLDDLVLKDYRETVSPQSPQVVLLSPSAAPGGYFAEVGYTSTDANAKLPGYDTVWRGDGGTLSVGHPVTLTFDNGAGLLFKRVFSVDENYMFTVAQSVENKGTAPVNLAP